MRRRDSHRGAGRPAAVRRDPTDPPEYSFAQVRSAVVVAARPYELVAGFGGSVAMLAARGVRVRVVAAANPRSAAGPEDRALLTALLRLGVADAEVIALGLPDASVSTLIPDLTRRLDFLVQGFDLCAAPWCPDRAAASGAVRWAALLACSLRLGPPLVEYCAEVGATADNGDQPWERAAWVRLSAASTRAKRSAVAGWPRDGSGHGLGGPAATGGPGPVCDRELVFR